MKLPIFEFLIGDEEGGVKAVSIVDDPAFQSSLVTFGKEQPKFVELSEKGKKKRICAGLSLIPNVLVYRIDPILGEYYGFFSAETIEKIVEKYHEEMNSNKVNLNHDPKKYIDAFMVEDYIVNTEQRAKDLKEKGIEHENIMGSWYTAFKIKDEKVFDQIVNGNSKTGFSVEAFLDTYLVQAQSQISKNKIKKEMKKNNKNLLEKIIDIFKKETMERALVPELGFQIEWTEVGAPVQQVIVDEEGNETYAPLGVGEYKTDEGVIIVDESSLLLEVRELPEEPEPEPEDELQLPTEEPEESVEPPVATVTGDTENKEEEMSSEIESETVVNEFETKFNAQVLAFTELQIKFDEVQKENEKLKVENDQLKEKMKEPITEPILEPVVEKKDWSKMSAYEKALYRARQ